MSSTSNLEIFVVDDYDSVLVGTVQSLQQQYPSAKVVTAQTGEEARNKLQELTPDVIIVDLSIPEKNGETGQPDTGIALLRYMLDTYPNLNLVVQSGYVKTLVRIKSLIDEHQAGFTVVDKSTSVQEMLEKVDWSLKGIVYTPPQLRVKLEVKAEWLKVLELAFEQCMNDKAIAQEMNIAERTVRHYWTKVQDVLEVYPEEGKSLRFQTEVKAREKGLIN